MYLFFFFTTTLDSMMDQSSDYRRIHIELNAMIGTLDQKIDSMIGKHEKDFMAAYRASLFYSYLFYFRDTC